MKKGPKPDEPRVTRECHHTLVTHRHGTVQAYHQDRCRCQACSDASWRTQKMSRIRGGNPTIDEFASASPVREGGVSEHVVREMRRHTRLCTTALR